jgi:hypothetical protein
MTLRRWALRRQYRENEHDDPSDANSRRQGGAAGAALFARPVLAQALLTRAIPSSGERLPAVGLGTAQVFNTNNDATRQKAGAILKALTAAGGSLVDTASVYGDV